MVKGGKKMNGGIDEQEHNNEIAKNLKSTIDKMKVQQRMIDLAARELQSTRIAMSSEKDDKTVFHENVSLIENKLMKLFARQLMHKHQYLTYLTNNREDSERSLDLIIGFELFLNIADLSQNKIKALLNEEKLTIDILYQMPHYNLIQLFSKYDLSMDESQKLMYLLSLLREYYDKWERGEKPQSLSYSRLDSSTRLNSVNSLASLESRKDSFTSQTISPPGNQGYSRSSTPITPVTPSSTHSPMLGGLNHQISTPVFPSVDGSPSFKRFNSTAITPSSYQGPVMDLSSSSSSINSDVPHHHVDQSPQPPQPPPPPAYLGSVTPRKTRKKGHTRSHSNPPLANIVMPEVVPEDSVVPDYQSPSPSSPAPPTRSGSHPSIIQNTVMNSPSAKTHPQMRRLMGHPNRTYSTDLGGEPDDFNSVPTHHEPPVRSNSEASNIQGSPRQRKLSKECGTSTSMVDLPLIQCNSDNHLYHNDYTMSSGGPGKSYSVPKLANLVINGENGAHSANQVPPTSPRQPTEYNPTGVIGHKIDHRFDKQIFFAVQECDYCKKTLVVNGLKCRYCKYKCHKQCSKLAPPTCGLPAYFLTYAREHKHLLSGSFETSTQTQPTLVKQRNFSSSGEYSLAPPTSPKIDDDAFVIPDLNREPANSQYSPVISKGRHLPRMVQSTSRLEVPHKLHPSPLHTNRSHTHSTSSSPSTSTHSSPCITPVSPRSPMDPHHMDYAVYTSGYASVSSSVPVILTDESIDDDDDDDGYDDPIGGIHRVRLISEEDDYSSSEAIENDISDESRIGGVSSRGLRPPPQVVSAQSLPNLLMADVANSSTEDDDLYTTSENNLQTRVKKESLINTLSTADSKTSTLVESILEDDDEVSIGDLDDSDYFNTSQGDFTGGQQRPLHRTSTVDEWTIPYGDLQIKEKIGSGHVANVYKGNWHGEVAIKTFHMPDATNDQLMRFREVIAILKKTRHENVALFMGACITPPNLAIITSCCKGYTLYKLIHQWSEAFSLEKLVNLGKQIAVAMGYLHARGVIHKGLNTKNIFIEKTTDKKDKVVITDMGLSGLSSSIWSSDHDSLLVFPRTQLYYLAPEIMQCVSAYRDPGILGDIYPFTEYSDVYCFGTILYEMITRKFPFTCDRLGFAYEYETVIFMVGHGTRQEFKMTDVPRKLKDLVWDCWTYTPEDRPSFRQLTESLGRLFRKHLPIMRSPSHPINLSKSVDNLLYI